MLWLSRLCLLLKSQTLLMDNILIDPFLRTFSTAFFPMCCAVGAPDVLLPVCGLPSRPGGPGCAWLPLRSPSCCCPTPPWGLFPAPCRAQEPSAFAKEEYQAMSLGCPWGSCPESCLRTGGIRNSQKARLWVSVAPQGIPSRCCWPLGSLC